MIINTTANIDVNTYDKIKEAAEMTGFPEMKLVHVMLKFVVKEAPFAYRSFMAVEYQEDRAKEDWVCYHLRLTEAVYESSHDMRKLMKYSVSFLLCYAVRVYLDKAVQMLTEDPDLDNYPDIYCIFAHHSEKKSLFTAIHTFPEQKDFPRHFTHPEEYT